MKGLIIFLAISSVFSIEFHFKIDASTKECFDEHLPAHTLISGEVKSDFPFTFGIADAEEHLLFSDVGVKESHYSVTTPSSGKFYICTYNPNQNTIDLEFKYLRGLEAKDFSSLPKKKSLSIIDSRLDELHKQANEIIDEIKGSASDADKKLEKSEHLGSKFIYAGIVTIIVLVVVALVQITYLKSYFRSKKLI